MGIRLANRFVLMFFCFIESDIGMISRFLEKAGNGNIKEVSTWLTWECRLIPKVLMVLRQ